MRTTWVKKCEIWESNRNHSELEASRMSRSNERPGAIEAGTDRYFRRDAAPSTGNLNPAQSKAYRAALERAAFILREAAAAGIKIGTDGVEVITVSSSRVPLATITALEAELVKNKLAVIALIERENAGRF